MTALIGMNKPEKDLLNAHQLRMMSLFISCSGYLLVGLRKLSTHRQPSDRMSNHLCGSRRN